MSQDSIHTGATLLAGGRVPCQPAVDCHHGSKIGEVHDYSVCTTWAVKSGTIYLLDVWRDRLEMPQLCRKVIELADHFNVERVVIEDKGAGTGLIQALRAQQFHKAVPFIPHTSKLERFEAITPRFEGGHVRVPRYAPWLEAYVDELCGFPNTAHDDQVDATSQALTYISTPFPGQGFLELCEADLREWNE